MITEAELVDILLAGSARVYVARIRQGHATPFPDLSPQRDASLAASRRTLFLLGTTRAHPQIIRPTERDDGYPVVWTFVDRGCAWFGITQYRSADGGEEAFFVTAIARDTIAIDPTKLLPRRLPERWHRTQVAGAARAEEE